MGVTVEEFPDGMAVTGGAKLIGATLPCHGDHRIAMAFAIAGLFAEGETIIEDTACVNTSYPGFAEALSSMGQFPPS
jgi:3-phosphoshikimate 1-carboxyvinyltransferase